MFELQVALPKVKVLQLETETQDSEILSPEDARLC